MRGRGRRIFVAAVLLLGATPAIAVEPTVGRSAEALIREAVAARLAVQAHVDVVSISLPSNRGDVLFTSVRIDPAAWLGRPLRITLTPTSGAPVIGATGVRVVASHVVAARDLERGARLVGADVEVREAELVGIPLRRLPQMEQIIGGRTLRTVKAGTILLPGAVAVRRAVEAGDEVTVVALVGEAEVSARLVAADGGEPGAVIRVTNPDTRRDLRARVVGEGRVEVMYAR